MDTVNSRIDTITLWTCRINKNVTRTHVFDIDKVGCWTKGFTALCCTAATQSAHYGKVTEVGGEALGKLPEDHGGWSRAGTWQGATFDPGRKPTKDRADLPGSLRPVVDRPPPGIL